MKKLTLALAALIFAAAPSSVFAFGPERGYHFQKHSKKHQHSFGNSRRPDFDRRYPDRRHHNYGNQSFMHNPLARGVQSGRLSRDEVRDLNRNAVELQHKKRGYLADGRLTRWERADLQDDQRDYYKDLQHQLNDGERRW